MLEHNAICERLRREHPDWTDDRLYDKARLINAALMAKIHTTEWTPAIIAHPTTRYALRVSWSGLVGERLRRRLGRIGSGDFLSGIPGSKTDHHGVPYSLTEEFVAVYRMHPLLPDEYTFHSLDRDEPPRERGFAELAALHARDQLAEIGMANGLYSFRDRPPRGDLALQLPALPTAPRCARTEASWTSPPSTSCARASAAFPATTSSGVSSA